MDILANGLMGFTAVWCVTLLLTGLLFVLIKVI